VHHHAWLSLHSSSYYYFNYTFEIWCSLYTYSTSGLGLTLFHVLRDFALLVAITLGSVGLEEQLTWGQPVKVSCYAGSRTPSNIL
jgi:hypothetical protein